MTNDERFDRLWRWVCLIIAILFAKFFFDTFNLKEMLPWKTR